MLRTSRPIPAAGDLLLAVQTEKLLIDGETGSAGRNQFSGRVRDVVYQGESLRIFITLDDGSTLSLRQPSHYEATIRIPPIGGILNVSLHPQDTIVVPKANE